MKTRVSRVNAVPSSRNSPFCYPPAVISHSPLATDVSRNSQAALVRFLKSSHRLETPRVERALLAVDRRHFVSPTFPVYVVYQDIPLPLGHDETISAPHMHATCLELLKDHAVEMSNILDVGSGSGYLTAALAVLGGIGSTVVGIEEHLQLVEKSQNNIRKSCPDLMMKPNPRVRILRGNELSEVLAENEFFDVIHVGAAAASIPSNLVERLKPGGRMVIPVGPKGEMQELMCVDRDDEGEVHMESVMPVRYVPLTEPTSSEEATHGL